ncbi:hypothetical protein JTB14_021626 [Gonioctena quinquepunctata]|nr:hypothetical protein JTB14_021626 [Gonioctena quinquepunctata]
MKETELAKEPKVDKPSGGKPSFCDAIKDARTTICELKPKEVKETEGRKKHNICYALLRDEKKNGNFRCPKSKDKQIPQIYDVPINTRKICAICKKGEKEKKNDGAKKSICENFKRESSQGSDQENKTKDSCTKKIMKRRKFGKVGMKKQ